MNGDGGKRRFVSTFRMQIQPARAPPAPGNGPGAACDTRSSDGGSLHLSVRERLDPPVFIEPVQDCRVDEGRDITLRGVVAGTPPIQVSWLHNGEAARFGKQSFNGREASLAVRECLPEDAGAYTCLAENGAGKTSCCAAVYVRDFEAICGAGVKIPTAASKSTMENGRCPPSSKDQPQGNGGSVCTSPTGSDKQSPASSPREVIPKKRDNSGKGAPPLHFANPPEHLKVKAGQAARVLCLFTGSPPVVSCWIRNKEQIVDGPELWTENTDHSSTLVIAKTQPQHTGSYTIVARDRRSSAQHTVTLSVLETPQPPASSPVISCVSASSLVLSWSGPCYDGGSAVLGYVVEVKGQGRAEAWSELTDQCRSTSYRACAGLRPREEYRFRVRAYNAVGASEPGPESPVVRMECRDSDKVQEEDTPRPTCVTIDSDHKVTDHYTLQEKLGMGKFGLVFKLTHKETGRVCAGKFYKGRRAKEREAARKEIELMNYLHHPKLVQCLAAYDHKPEMVMVMEFIAGGELFERIVDDNFEHTEPASARYMQQMLEGIAYLHGQNIVHLDLKPENIVCVDTHGTSIKIIDFGLASRLDGAPLKVMHGTPEFVAPEVINYEPVYLCTDMWSIGVICYILLSGESPFQGNSDAETLALVTAAQWEFDEESFEDITDEAKDFISSLLNKDTRRRMNCGEALAHPWIAVFDSKELTTTKCLSKEKMKKFLARQKWKKAGKAMLALKRMALLSKSESSGSPTSPGAGSPLSPEAEHALLSLEQKMQGPPCFTQSLEDQTVVQGSSARLSCHLTGYPDPEVVWLCGDEPVVESPTMGIEYKEDGRCTLVLAKVAPEDANVYTCRATNDHGETFCSANLTVQK